MDVKVNSYTLLVIQNELGTVVSIKSTYPDIETMYDEEYDFLHSIGLENITDVISVTTFGGRNK